MRKEFRDNRTGLLKGYIDELGSRTTAFDCFGKQIGYYDKDLGYTFDIRNGTVYSRGSNDLAALIGESWQDNKHFFGSNV